MANIIDESYFWEYEIAGITASTIGTTQQVGINNKLSKFQLFINKYQKKYLESMFGKTLAANLPNELKELLYDEETKTSPIANYVYFFYQRANETRTTAAGEKKLTVQNTVPTSNYPKRVQAWNEMVARNIEIHNDLSELGTLEYAEPLDYVTDILYNIDTNDNIFTDINIFNI